MTDIRPVTPDFAVAPQLSPDDMATVAERGFTLVINNRPDEEVEGQPTSAQMQAAAESAGMHYVHIPVRGVRTPNRSWQCATPSTALTVRCWPSAALEPGRSAPGRSVRRKRERSRARLSSGWGRLLDTTSPAFCYSPDQRGWIATRTAPIGRGSSWQSESEMFNSCTAMRHSKRRHRGLEPF